MEYGLLGEHLGHSYSREIHEQIADYRYELLEFAPDQMPSFLAKREFKAINVTIPYKEAVIPYLDWVSETAKRIGAVNTIINRNGKLYGYNTDYSGMLSLIRHSGIDLTRKKVLILGTGGTSKTAHAAAETFDPVCILNVSRKSSPNTVTYEEAMSKHNDAQIIINTTPVGMYPNVGNKPIDISGFSKLSGIIDVIYNPLKTELVLDGLARGIDAVGGLYMLSAQAVHASSLFLDIKPDQALIELAYNTVLKKKINIILTGMPTSGKTAVGMQLAKLTEKKFVDTDQIIVSRTGMAISEYFKRFGEPAFRKLESEVIAEISSQNGCIIATGGGSILDPNNIRALRRNGIIVFLDKPLSELVPSADRPLSSDWETMKTLYENRYGVYKASSDLQINNCGTVEEGAESIIKEVLQ